VRNDTIYNIGGAEFTITVLIDGAPKTFTIKGGQTLGPIAVPEGADVAVIESDLPRNFELVSISEPIPDGETGDLYVTVENLYNPPPPTPTPPPTPPPPTPTVPPTATPTPTETPTPSETPTPTESPTPTPTPTEPPPPSVTETPMPPPPLPSGPEGPDDEDYYDIGDDDSPMGSWVWDEDTGEWIFVPEIPKTGDAGVIGWIIAFGAAVTLGVIILSPSRKRGGK
jgi:hypothetical protein